MVPTHVQLSLNSRGRRAVKTGSAETPQRGPRLLAAPEELRRAAGRFVSRRNAVRDLLLFAKYLFAAARTVVHGLQSSARLW
jgi:hypothetical protein